MTQRQTEAELEGSQVLPSSDISKEHLLTPKCGEEVELLNLDLNISFKLSMQQTLIVDKILNRHSRITQNLDSWISQPATLPVSRSLLQINSFVCSSNTSRCFHLSLSAGSQLDALSCAVVMLWIKKVKLNCLIGFLGKGKTDLNWLPVMAFCGTTLASAVWGGFSKTN